MRANEKAALIETVGTFIAERLKSALDPIVQRLKAVEDRQPERGEKGDPGKDGKDGRDGADGKDGAPGRDGAAGTVDPELIARAVAEEVANIPPATNGKDGEPGRDGRDGLPGRDGKDGAPGEAGKDGTDGLNGRDGLGFDDLTVDYDGERTVTLRFAAGDRVKEFPIKFPVIIDRGVWKDGQTYERGDAVTWGGSLHVAKKDTSTKPDTPDSDWRLSAKRGRDGKDGKAGEKGLKGDKGDRGEQGPRGYGG